MKVKIFILNIELKNIIKEMRKPYKLISSNKSTNAMKEGFCIQEWKDGTVLKGKFSENKLEGVAKIWTADGKIFEGQ